MSNPIVPEGAWETHMHIFDSGKIPYSNPRSHTPQAAHLVDYPVNITGCRNIVHVQSSVQGASPSPVLDTLEKQKLFPGYKLRGIATIDINTITDEELDALHTAGVRGVRLHEVSWGVGRQSTTEDIIKKAKSLADRLARLNWVIDILTNVQTWDKMADAVRQMDPRVKIMAEHCGGAMPGDEELPEFKTFLELLREGRLYVKISSLERMYDGKPEGIEAATPIVAAIIKAGPDQIVYGSDWPHTQFGKTRKGKTPQQRLEPEAHRDVDEAGTIQKLREWIPDEETWVKFWVTNPEKLFN